MVYGVLQTEFAAGSPAGWRYRSTAAAAAGECGDAENAGREKYGGGKGRTGEHGNIMCMGSET